MLTEGSSIERKAAIEALIAEIRLTDDGAVPVFRIPDDDTAIPADDQPPVRTRVRPVGPVGLEPTIPRIPKGSWNETAWGSTWDYTGQLSVSTYSSSTGQQQFVPRTMPRAPLYLLRRDAVAAPARPQFHKPPGCDAG
jgi:hypothetical protein